LNSEILQPSKIEISGSVVNATCNGIANGSIDITGNGGAGGYSYTWSNSSISEDLSLLNPGTYIVTVKDSTGCSAYKSFTVSADTKIQVTATFALPTCNQTNGSINITVNGGTSPYTYNWTNGATTEDIQNIGTGFYKVEITDANGCKTESGYNLKENNTLKLSASVTQTNCVDDASGAVDLTVTGGTAPYTYSWSNGLITEDLSNLSTGLYTVIVTDANGCTATLRVSVSKKTLDVNASVTQPLCNGDATGSITITSVNGVSPFTYLWSTGDTGTSIDGLSPGSYNVTVTDSTGCSRKLYFVINNPPAINASVVVTNSNCNTYGYYNIDLSVTGGTQPYTYEWGNGTTTEDLSNLNAGTYTVAIKDANGCTINKEVIVEELSVWTCLITSPTVNPVCSSNNNTLNTAILDADSYNWSISSTDGQWLITSGSTSSQIAYTSGASGSNASFTLTISKDGCIQTCSITLATCTSNDTSGGGGSDGGDSNDGADPTDPGDGCDDTPGGGDAETCDECFDTIITNKTDNGSCTNYEIIVSTDGNCRYELSHWVIAMPGGTIQNIWNSEGWKMEVGKDPTTGLYGLKVDDINGFGKEVASFTVRFSVCNTDLCGDVYNDWTPVVSYKAGQCVAYDSVEMPQFTSTTFTVNVYPIPFEDQLSFGWVADADEPVNLEIYNQHGVLLTEVFNFTAKKGTQYKFDWVAPGLRDSFYFYRFTSGNRIFNGKLFKIR